jgi:glucose-6-phosphate 1-dehydrogenase
MQTPSPSPLPFSCASEDQASIANRSVLVILGASGDLTKRLLMPALYNLACDGLLPEEFAIIGMARREWTHEVFRELQRADIEKFKTRKAVDPERWAWLESRLYYCQGEFGDAAAYSRLKTMVQEVGARVGATGNTLLYLAISPDQFDEVNQQLDAAGFPQLPGQKRIIVEKPFGKDLSSAIALNQSLLSKWREDQIYRIDHYLGKETVQNLLAFRIANGIFAPLWTAEHIDHIQISAMETVGVETRGDYYDKSGVIRDMIQNHLFQMLAYICMDLPKSLDPSVVRDEKSRLLKSVRMLDRAAVDRDCVRGQYGPSEKGDGTKIKGYRQEDKVNPESNMETYAALKLHLDNDRWRGMPVYLRSGKSLWKRGTEIVVHFKPASQSLVANTPAAGSIEANKLIFHIQPVQAVEMLMQAKRPGPTFVLQDAGMRFDYAETFEASRGTGYEVLLYSAMNGDPTLFSRTDFVETSWQIVQPVLDAWSTTKATEYPNYNSGTWGPRAANQLLTRDGRHWHEVLNRDILARCSLFKVDSPVFLNNVMLALKPMAVEAGATICEYGERKCEMYFICQGEAEILDAAGEPIDKIREGSFFGEMSLVFNEPRTATVRAIRPCDLLILDGNDYHRIVRDFPDAEKEIRRIAEERRAANTAKKPQG